MMATLFRGFRCSGLGGGKKMIDAILTNDCALHGVSPRDRWLCVLPSWRLNVNVHVNVILSIVQNLQISGRHRKKPQIGAAPDLSHRCGGSRASLSLAAPAARLRQRSAAAISGHKLRPAYLQSIYEHDSVARLAHARPPLCSPSRSQLKQLCRSLSLRWLPWASRLLRL